MVGHLLLRSGQKDLTICLTLGEELSFTHLGYTLLFTVPRTIHNPTTAQGVLLFMSTAVFYYLVFEA